jgi:hypothetical protein
VVDADVQGLVDLALNKWTLLTAGGVFFLLRVISQLPWLSTTNAYRRLLPVLPELLAVGATLAGGNPAVDSSPIVLKVAAGLWCGYLAQRFHKVLGQTILGDDRSITATPRAAPESAPVKEEA